MSRRWALAATAGALALAAAGGGIAATVAGGSSPAAAVTGPGPLGDQHGPAVLVSCEGQGRARVTYGVPAAGAVTETLRIGGKVAHTWTLTGGPYTEWYSRVPARGEKASITENGKTTSFVLPHC